jgi:hypothetical protein
MNTAGAPSVDATARRDYLILAALTGLLSTAAVWFYYSRGAILLYGDAPAHINIARRVFDSRTPGVFQLGTVWLPLPHLLEIPFIANGWLWHTGLGASVPSMLAYVAGALGIFRLVRGLASRTTAWIAVAIYALNPNLIYMQSTAMTEPLYLALFIWTMVFFSEFVRTAKDRPDQARRSVEKCAITLSASMLARYDAWFLAAVLWVAVILYWLKARQSTGLLRRGVINFLLLTFLTACLWLAYNHANYDNALEFANGPFSASAIQQRSRTASMPSYPGELSARAAALYFLKASRMNLGEGRAEHLLFDAAFVALLSVIYFARRFWPWILLWTPLLFYTACVAWGSVPIYVPEWWPFSYYNVRYGLQMLPAVAVFVALGYELLSKLLPERRVAAVVALVIVLSYLSLLPRTPICLREAQANGKERLQFDQQLADQLKRLPAQSSIMMDCGAHPGAVELAGIPFRRVLRESNPPYWEVALTRPAQSADYVVAIDGDDLWRAVRLFPQGLRPLAAIGASPGPRAVVYQSERE